MQTANGAVALSAQTIWWKEAGRPGHLTAMEMVIHSSTCRKGRYGNAPSPRCFPCFPTAVIISPSKKRYPRHHVLHVVFLFVPLPISIYSVFSLPMAIGRDLAAVQQRLLGVLLPPSDPLQRRNPFHEALCLSFRTTEESLRNAFQNFGQLVEVNLVMDRIANRPRGFAFLRYATEGESKKAIEGMHGKFLDGRVIFVEVAKPRSEVRQASRQTPPRY
ncbi:hypothetical protein MUK42_20257 [Musa troglodytarum]|uniref:RRM domain-containing protein n=1 Tax=Musa troglodytarum TaxID=320322 RepID=A0A9E7K3M4_9LILI|nr:hypothetical protein MUK42_20257 [Musa troglodytarum]